MIVDPSVFSVAVRKHNVCRGLFKYANTGDLQYLVQSFPHAGSLFQNRHQEIGADRTPNLAAYRIL
jgi:hypothetical protein